MKLCRFTAAGLAGDRLGLVRDGTILDVSDALDVIPPAHWPLPLGDLLVAHLAAVRARAGEAAGTATAFDMADVMLKSPVANPSKIIAAPVNYQKHLDEAREDTEINVGKVVARIAEAGLFLKASSSLVGPGEGIARRFPDRRTDHECELAVIIGEPGSEIPAAAAFDHVAGYAIGLDMSVRGSEDRSYRKSVDSYSVLGPWLVTADEIADPGNLNFEITVNGETRQKSNTKYLIWDIPTLIENASRFYTLWPGDVIMTGTPEGVGPVVPGDVMVAEMDGIGRMEIAVRDA